MKNNCHVIKIETPRKYLLDGLWFGPEKPKKAVIFVHGLGSSAFGGLKIITPLVNKDTAVITFSNRGHDKVARIRKINKHRKKGYISETVGQAHEVFTDCVDDIDGVVNFAIKNGAREIYLCGHSTGCQKSIYYLVNKNNKKIKGVALLCPISDYADTKKFTDPKLLKKVEIFSRKLVKNKKSHELLPTDLWPSLVDAQRFLSLYTPNSKEEIFCYASPKIKPKTLQKVKIPILILFAGADEHLDRNVQELVEWFGSNLKSKNMSIQIIERASHSFTDKEEQAARKIKNWINNL